MSQDLNVYINGEELDQLIEIIISGENIMPGHEDLFGEIVGKAIAFTRIYLEYRIRMGERAKVPEIMGFLATLDERLGTHTGKSQMIN
jgi:hypothetical protein